MNQMNNLNIDLLVQYDKIKEYQIQLNKSEKDLKRQKIKDKIFIVVR